ncbi:Eco57I restriction-modification methylase domain-containing protein [Pseudoramibacter porci]|uniref:Restriction endonuclease n=1 Tax=Pseudoramibacter porci TaxID=2606631 RepID=A0A7X2TAM4_9FIRM|nr:Eco57I restriction-modification methylase domain-containing protein [Pseudoramibacter porci]MSS20617.1 restriction endonuclease [Pseudoramibacter porci]
MQSNFDFLSQDDETKAYVQDAKNAEKQYALEMYGAVPVTVRKIAETLARQILDRHYIEMDAYSTFNDCLRELENRRLVGQKVLDCFNGIRRAGNRAAHDLTQGSKKEGLSALKRAYALLAWFYQNDTGERFKPDFVEPVDNQYHTAERKVIYIQTADNTSGKWQVYDGKEKIGDATADDYEVDNRPNSDDLRKMADRRIRQYMTTAGVPYKLQWSELAYRKSDKSWFRDYDVHRVLERSGIKKTEVTSGNEWFETDLETAKAAIKAVKEGRTSIQALPGQQEQAPIVLRPEQQEAIRKTKKAYKHGDKMLWNAKMRFGKTLSTMQLVKEEGFAHVLILTHRPIVDEGWFADFKKIGMPEAGYRYGSKNEGESFESLMRYGGPYVYFASLQDLRGSEMVGGSAGDKNRELFNNLWDLVIIDEAHEGTQTELAQSVMHQVITEKHTKLLELSGTAFNLIDQYDADQVFTWDYVMEQSAKANWPTIHGNVPNPYAGLPKVLMYTFEMHHQFDDERFLGEDKRAFNFKTFFMTKADGTFVYADQVAQFLRNITTPDLKTCYPFSTRAFRDQLRHTLWILPGIKEANALEAMLKKDPVFGMEYRIINVVRSGDAEIASQSDIDKVNQAMGPDPAKTKTITLTVRKMTTGVTIKPWTGVLFLSNTNSATQYLQAAFRAQTPYASETFGQKTQCFIFDFAPDRALTVMAQAAQMNTGVGKRTSSAQKQKMAELMNFLPILGETGHGMKPYKVDTMLAKIKRVYAEKAVRTGFDDDSIYSDALLMLDAADLSDFNDLKAIVGTTKAEKKAIQIEINHQGLDEEAYKKALDAEKKTKRERSPEEQAALDKMKALKKQRKTMISILRSISIRIPMMIYGMAIDIDRDVKIDQFTRLVDDASWQEFMPEGVTKALFRKFIKYYDADVFIEAGRIIRRRAKALDAYEPVERAEKLALIFGTFRNPDKETVLTPWRVVNLHMGKTLGGLSFYDRKWQHTTVDGKPVTRWIKTDDTDRIFSPYTHILEINSKTGLYPLYAAISIYHLECSQLYQRTGGKAGRAERQLLWQRILRNNIFVVAKTPMAKAITQRTLAGYQDLDTNVYYVEDIVAGAKADAKAEAKKIGEYFGMMKFDVVIGNPPYQESAKGESTRDEPIYHNFMNLAYELSDLVTLITPGRFLFNAGQTPKAWNKKMLNDPHLKVVMYEKDSSEIFPKTDIKGGVVITLRDVNQDFGKIGTFTPYETLNAIVKKVWADHKKKSLSEIVSSRGNYRFTEKFFDDYPDASKRLGKGTGNMIVSNAFEKLPEVFDKEESENCYKFIGRINNRRVFRYIEKSYVQKNDYIDKYKVMLPEANGRGELGETLSSPLIGKPNEGATDTFISIGAFNSEKEAEALLKYIKTKFLRALLGVKKATQHNPKSVWQFVPMQDFTKNADIDWSQSVAEIDQQLYKKYQLSDDEINFIETKVQAMD